MSRSNLGPDPSEWSNSKVTGVGMSIAGTVGGAMAAVLVNALQANKRPVRELSAQALHDAEVDFLRKDLSLMGLRLQYSQRNGRELGKRVAELEAAAWEREYRDRY